MDLWTVSTDMYFLELFSGNADVSKVASRIFDCPSESVDLDPDADCTHRMDILTWDAATTDTFRKKYKDDAPVIWASPPCESFSRVNSRGIRDLEKADAHVRKVQEIAEGLGAKIVLLEHPATGLLVSRDVIKFLKYRVDVDYCQYGNFIKKSTSIWSNIDLKAYGFKPLTCPGQDCLAKYEDPWTGRTKHIFMWDDVKYQQRISIPIQLITSLLRAAERCMRTFHVRARKRDSEEFSKRKRTETFEVNYSRRKC